MYLFLYFKKLQHCIDQDFDDSGIPVCKNSVFIEEFLINLKFLFNKLEVKLGKLLKYLFYLRIHNKY